MMRRRVALVAVAGAMYMCSMLVAFGAAGAVGHGLASFASDLVPSANAHGNPSGPYGQYGRTTLCHNGVTITVDDAAVAMHLDHGDTLGPCPPGTPHPKPRP